MKKLLVALTVLAPSFAFAQNFSNLNNAATGLKDVIKGLTNTVNAVVPFLIAIAVIVFIYGVIKYVIAKGAEDKGTARNYIIFGIIGIAVIIALFGLAKFLTNIFGLGGTTLTNTDIPVVPTSTV